MVSISRRLRCPQPSLGVLLTRLIERKSGERAIHEGSWSRANSQSHVGRRHHLSSSCPCRSNQARPGVSRITRPIRASKAIDQQHSRIVLTTTLHLGSILIAIGIGVIALGRPDPLLGVIAIALGASVWIRMIRKALRTS